MVKTYSLDKMSVTNMLLAGIISLLLVYYVVVANSIAARNYKIQKLNEQLFSLIEANSSLMAQRSSLEDTGLLANFAKNNNMVEARNISYLFENKNVALRP